MITTIGLLPQCAIVDSACAVIWNPPSPQMQRFTESAPVIKYSAIHRQRSVIVFPAGLDQPAIHHGGVDVSADDIVFYGSGVSIHRRTTASSEWGVNVLSPNFLAKAASVLRCGKPIARRRAWPPSPGATVSASLAASRASIAPPMARRRRPRCGCSVPEARLEKFAYLAELHIRSLGPAVLMA